MLLEIAIVHILPYSDRQNVLLTTSVLAILLPQRLKGSKQSSVAVTGTAEYGYKEEY